MSAPPTLGLPKSGGALRGLGEAFKAGGPTGTGAYSVPFPLPAARGFEPKLAVQYDAGHGQGVFGMGWSLGVPEISRRTDKVGLPRYLDEINGDVFTLTGGDDLEPLLGVDAATGKREPVSSIIGGYRVWLYRPRVEVAFARVERWVDQTTGDVHWRTISADNVTQLYGLSPGGRVVDPANPKHIFRWLLEGAFESHGNAIWYEYKAEDSAGAPTLDLQRTIANAYPKRVHYGNRAPLTAAEPTIADFAAQSWLFEVVLDYGEHATDTRDEVSPWAARQDPFSSFRPGFDLRTYRLCQRVLVFHAMPEQLGAPARLVKALEFSYEQSPAVTYLTGIRAAGYAWTAQDQVTIEYLPALTLDYTRAGALARTVQTIASRSVAGAPVGTTDGNVQLVDLDGEGVPGFLIATPRQLSYKHNLGSARFSSPARLPVRPNLSLHDAHLMSLNNDGHLDLVSFHADELGYYQRGDATGNGQIYPTWSRWQPIARAPNLRWDVQGVRMIDVDGDGRTDVVVSDGRALTAYRWRGHGFGAGTRVAVAESRHVPVTLTTEDFSTVFTADMTGDGLADFVRIRNGSIEYWPNLGYGVFGARVTMANAPVFDAANQFDPRRLRLGDIDGTGTTDLVYFSARGATVYRNQAGNGWSDGEVIGGPPLNQLTHVQFADLLGTGTACLVWSSSAPADMGHPLRYIDLLNSTKPHLLCKIDNGLGATTQITYAPSTTYYLEDQARGRPWLTRVPFPVQTVARVETTDVIAGTQRVQRYRYKHGYYDGAEREFRGFARVDTWDADAVSATGAPASVPLETSDGAFQLPPVHAITWFHTGARNLDRSDLTHALRTEFYAGDPSAQRLPATTFTPYAPNTGMYGVAQRDALLALRGQPIRQEVYADDGSPAANAPYSVTEYRYEVRELQTPEQVPTPQERGRHLFHGRYHPFQREQVTYAYERNAADPRVAHHLALEVDPLGHVVRDATIAYARRAVNAPDAVQARALATCTQTTYAPLQGPVDAFRHGVVTEVQRFELALPDATTSQVQPFATIDAAMTGAATVAYDVPLGANQKRLIEHVKVQFWADDLSAPLAQGSTGLKALPYDQFALALPATQLTSVLGTRITGIDLTAAGYVSPDGDYWIHAGVTTYEASAFDQPSTFTDPFGNTARVVYDNYKLFVTESHTSSNAAFDNVTTQTIDYRVLSPSLVTDPNGNRSAAAYDELGRVTAIALMGRDGVNEGDTLADPTVKLEYNLAANPPYVHTWARREHGAANTGWLESYAYSDGLGHAILTKTMAAPGADGAARWIGSGRVVVDNKGNPVKKYEPYFAPTPAYDAESAIASSAFCAVVTYDPLSRAVRTDIADGTFTTTTFGPWSQSVADANDNVLTSAWYADANARPVTDPLKRAAQLTAAHANTPTVTTLDPLGRAYVVAVDNGGGDVRRTHTTLDIQGNALSVTDPLGNVVVAQTFDVRGHVLQSVGSDTGTALALTDGAGQPLRTWDARGFAHRTTYDVLHRPAQLWATPPSGTEFLAQLTVYGEGLSQPDYRGRVYLAFDGSGVVANTAYDFEGHVTSATRSFALAYTTTPAWDSLASIVDPTAVLPAAASLLDTEVFTTASTYDALGHVISVATPDGSVTTSTFDTGGKLAAVASAVRGATAATPIVASIEYDANGFRTQVSSGSGLVSTYTYDPRNHRVITIRTTRSGDGAALQDLSYTHDPVGNIVEIDDAAQQTVYFSGTVTSGTQQFTYDPIYQLTSATGREQPGQVGFVAGTNGYPDPQLFTALPHSNDNQALVPYTESYTYDVAGNLLATAHAAPSANWTRTQSITPGTNQLDSLSLPGDPSSGPYTGIFAHDAAGNLTKLPSLAALIYDHAGRFVSADLGGGGTAYFTYDAAGQRARKVVVRGGKVLERLYIGSFERYREQSAATSTVSLERQSLHISDGERRFVQIDSKITDTSIAGGFTPTPLFRYQLPNHLQSSCIETDAAGAVISYEEYYPYGGTSFHATTADDRRYRFAGKERDAETGLYCIGVRYYAPWLGRWTSPDPAGFIEGTNPYRYCRNSPLTLRDSNGMQPAPAPPIPPPAEAPWWWSPPIGSPAAEYPTWAPPPPVVPAPAAAETGAAELGATEATTSSLSLGVWALIGAFFNALDDHPHPHIEPRPQQPPPSLPPARTYRRVPHRTIPDESPRIGPVPVPTEQKPDSRRRKRDPEPKTANLDTGAIVDATQLSHPFFAAGLQLTLLGYHTVVTKAAKEEFLNGPYQHAGTIERIAARTFLFFVEEIPNNPSDRVMAMKGVSKNQLKALGDIDKKTGAPKKSVDRIVFGTSDRFRYTTFTSDGAFPKVASKLGVDLAKIIPLPPLQYRGN